MDARGFVVERTYAIIAAMLKRRSLLILFVLVLILAGGLAYFRVQGTRTITGVARDAETRAPIEGAVVAIEGGNQTTTNAQGEYALDAWRGQWSISANADGYLAAREDLNAEDVVTQAYALDLALTPTRLMGYVIDAETNQTLANASMVVGDKKVNLSPQGAFNVRSVKMGTPIAVEMVGYQSAALTFSGDSVFNIPMVPITVTVHVSDAGGKPVASAQVQAGDQTATTNTAGVAVLRRIQPGTTFRASAAGYGAAMAPFSSGVIQMTLRPTLLEGTITDATSGKPIPNALVYIGTTYITTTIQGAYRIPDAPISTTLAVMAPGYAKTAVTTSGEARRDIKLQPFLVKGIHVPFGLAPDKLRERFDLIKNTELNAIVLDVKAEKGNVAWDTQVPLAKQVGAAWLHGTDLKQVIQWCRAEKVYCIARMPVFQDTLLATKRPDLALRLPNGNPYLDNNQSGWTNAASPTVWDYNIALAKEAAAFGFDEVQFDYIRFPGHADGVYTGTIATEEGRVAEIGGFLARAQKELRPLGVYISADVFGLTTAVEDDQYTGQHLRDLGPYLDYISPMVYPDVWNDASFLLAHGLQINGCTVAVRCPYDVIFNSYKRAAEKTTAKVRLWLQAYSGRGNFGVDEYKIQKKAAEEAGSAGWMFWSGTGTYDAKTFGPP